MLAPLRWRHALAVMLLLAALLAGAAAPAPAAEGPPLVWREIAVGMSGEEAATRLRRMGLRTQQTEWGYRSPNPNTAVISAFPGGRRCERFSGPVCEEVFLSILRRPGGGTVVWNINVASSLAEEALVEPIIQAARARYGEPTSAEWSADTLGDRRTLPRWGRWDVVWGQPDPTVAEDHVRLMASTLVTGRSASATLPSGLPASARTKAVELTVSRPALLNEVRAQHEAAERRAPPRLRL